MRPVATACTAFALTVFFGCEARPTTVRLEATADIGACSITWRGVNYRQLSWGLSNRFKLKSIQEMALIRFDADPIRDREVLSARLFLHRAGEDMLRYIRVSTVSSDWEEGETAEDYGPPSGSCFDYADWDTKRNWSWPGSTLADVVMSSGNTRHHWTERVELDDGWISVELTPELVYALVADDTDGLAVQDGGNLAYFNNWIHSVQSGEFAPYIEVELGGRRNRTPARPAIRVRQAAERARMDSGALEVTIAPAANVFSFRLYLDDERVERWRVRAPAPAGPTVIYLEDLEPSREYELAVEAVAPWGRVSRRAVARVAASPSLAAPPDLGEFEEPRHVARSVAHSGRMQAWPLPGLVKISPLDPAVMFGDTVEHPREANAVWDGRRIGLFGARGEYVSFQICVENLSAEPLEAIRIEPASLAGPDGFEIGGAEIELFRNWYAKNRSGDWHPAYNIPLEHGVQFRIPDPQRGIEEQQNQTIYVDIYIPKNAPEGRYAGTFTVQAEGAGEVFLPVELDVLNFELPDRLSFWPMINCYQAFSPAHAYYRLAHQHRSVLYFRAWRPGLEGAGSDIKVIWDRYEDIVGPLLDGSAFKDNRRAGQPIEALLLPYADSWPTPLSPETYNYTGYWPGRGDDVKHLNEHYMTAPYIGDALSQSYKDAFLSVQQQFINRFAENGYDQTEFHIAYVGKNTHRIDYGSNMWWTTDEPYHWVDWVALRYFNELWTQGRGDADPSRWMTRSDISRPEWQGRILEGVMDTVYFGGTINAPGGLRRLEWLVRETGIKPMAYGASNSDNTSNNGTVAWIVGTWLNGMNGTLPWQGLGNERALDINDSAVGGNALLCPGDRFGLDVVGDMRLKAMRDAQQIVEYLELVAGKYDLNREQCRAMVQAALEVGVRVREGAGADNADALRFSELKAWQLQELRRALARLIEN